MRGRAMTWKYRYNDSHDMYDDDLGYDDECGHDVLERRREAEEERIAEERELEALKKRKAER